MMAAEHSRSTVRSVSVCKGCYVCSLHICRVKLITMSGLGCMLPCRACNDSGYCLMPVVLILSRYLQLIEWQVWKSRFRSDKMKQQVGGTMMGVRRTQT